MRLTAFRFIRALGIGAALAAVGAGAWWAWRGYQTEQAATAAAEDVCMAITGRSLLEDARPIDRVRTDAVKETASRLSLMDKAEACYRKSVALIKKRFNSDHPELLTYLNNLGGVLRETKQYTEAEAVFRRTLRIAENSVGPDHSKTADALSNLAGLRLLQDPKADVGPTVERALAIR